jgi:hypothetical protein
MRIRNTTIALVAPKTLLENQRFQVSIRSILFVAKLFFISFEKDTLLRAAAGCEYNNIREGQAHCSFYDA